MGQVLRQIPVSPSLAAADFPYHQLVEAWPESGCHLLVETALWQGSVQDTDPCLEGSDICWGDGVHSCYTAVVILRGRPVVSGSGCKHFHAMLKLSDRPYKRSTADRMRAAVLIVIVRGHLHPDKLAHIGDHFSTCARVLGKLRDSASSLGHAEHLSSFCLWLSTGQRRPRLALWSRLWLAE